MQNAEVVRSTLFNERVLSERVAHCRHYSSVIIGILTLLNLVPLDASSGVRSVIAIILLVMSLVTLLVAIRSEEGLAIVRHRIDNNSTNR